MTYNVFGGTLNPILLLGYCIFSQRGVAGSHFYSARVLSKFIAYFIAPSCIGVMFKSPCIRTRVCDYSRIPSAHYRASKSYGLTATRSLSFHPYVYLYIRRLLLSHAKEL